MFPTTPERINLFLCVSCGTRKNIFGFGGLGKGGIVFLIVNQIWNFNEILIVCFHSYLPLLSNNKKNSVLYREWRAADLTDEWRRLKRRRMEDFIWRHIFTFSSRFILPIFHISHQRPKKSEL